MKSMFYDLADFAKTKLSGGEEFTAWLSGETSEFCRLNGAKIRQAGTVQQGGLSLRLIKGQKNAEGYVSLSLVKAEDQERVAGLIKTLRDQLAELPDDPYLMYSTDVRSTETVHENKLPDHREVVRKVAERAKSLDLVGLYAGGTMVRGFANSLGQRNWYETFSFNFDWSVYLRADKAVKTGYAGMSWSEEDFARKLDAARTQLAVLERDPKTLKPGRYRVFLTPSALNEVTDMLSWGGFSLKAHRTKQTPLIKMVESDQRMNGAVTLRENTKGGLSPSFNASGYVKPDTVTMIDAGVYKDSLASPRSAKEYGVPTNGASDRETPASLEMGAGQLALERAAADVGEGLFVNNLWYLNFSDKPACRVTGMTRFATFWVEGGKIVAPVNVMRFDESVLRMFGEKLVGLTKEREMILSASTYGERSTGSVHLPGALVDDFAFTL